MFPAASASAASWVSRLPQYAQEHLPDAVAQGLNRTAIEAQFAMRQRLYRDFTIRGANVAQWFEKMIYIGPTDRATRYQLETYVRVEGTQAGGIAAQRRARALLFRHEDGGIESPANTFFGAFYMPAPGLRTMSTNPPRALYPKNLGLQPRRKIDGGFTKAGTQGKLRTYVVPGVGIFQRVGRDQDIGGVRHFGSVPLWFFYTKPYMLQPRLHFHETIDRVTRDRLVPNIEFFIGQQLAIGARRLSFGSASADVSSAALGI